MVSAAVAAACYILPPIRALKLESPTSSARIMIRSNLHAYLATIMLRSPMVGAHDGPSIDRISARYDLVDCRSTIPIPTLGPAMLRTRKRTVTDRDRIIEFVVGIRLTERFAAVEMDDVVLCIGIGLVPLDLAQDQPSESRRRGGFRWEGHHGRRKLRWTQSNIGK